MTEDDPGPGGQLPPPLEGANGRYLPQRELGRGSSGITYLCQREADGAQFVLKELRLDMIDEWKSLELFEREVATLRSLDHPGIPSYVDAVLDRDSGRFALVQEYVEGRTLDAIIRAGETLAIEQFEAYLRGTLEILAYLQGRVPPVIHRDIKPRNLMITADRVYLIDFGAVRLALTESTTMTSVGTFGYMAPEQMRGRATPASDLYGLGMTFIALAARREPSDIPVDPASGQIDPSCVLHLPQPLRGVLLAMIEPGLGNRLGEASAALSRLEGQATAPLAPTTHTTSPTRWGRRLRRATAVVATLCSIVLVGGYVVSRIPAPGELRSLGGWFSGHGSTLAAIQMTLIGTAIVEHPKWIGALAFSPDGEVLASKANGDGLILWRVADGEILARSEDYQDLRSLAYSPTGDTLVGVNWRGEVAVYNPETAELIRTYNAETVAVEAHEEGHFRVNDLWVGSSSEILIAGLWEPPHAQSFDVPGARDPLVAMVVNPVTSALVTSHELDWKSVQGAAISRRGERLALIGRARDVTLATHTNTNTDGNDNDNDNDNYRILAIDMRSGRQLLAASTRRENRAVIFTEHPDQFLTLSYDGLYRWDAARGERLGSLGTHESNYNARLAVSPTGERVAITGYRSASIVDLDGGDRLTERAGHVRDIISLAFSPDGSILATGGSDQRIKLWSVP